MTAQCSVSSAVSKYQCGKKIPRSLRNRSLKKTDFTERIKPRTLRLNVRCSTTEPSARFENIKLIGNINATQFNFCFN